MSNAVWLLAESLCSQAPDEVEAGAPDIWGALLAGQVLAEITVLSKVSSVNRTKLDRVRKWLVRIVEGNRLPALERLNAGNV